MRETSRTAAIAAMLAAAGLGGLNVVVDGRIVQDRQEARQLAQQNQPATGIARSADGSAVLRRMFGGGSYSSGAGGYLSRAGWTNARYQRHARKLRNRARHRRACRG